MSSNTLGRRPVSELLADVERYERWAELTLWNERLSAEFRRLAQDARSRARSAKI